MQSLPPPSVPFPPSVTSLKRVSRSAQWWNALEVSFAGRIEEQTELRDMPMTSQTVFPIPTRTRLRSECKSKVPSHKAAVHEAYVLPDPCGTCHHKNHELDLQCPLSGDPFALLLIVWARALRGTDDGMIHSGWPRFDVFLRRGLSGDAFPLSPHFFPMSN